MIERPNVDALMAGDLGHFLQGQVQVRDDARAKRNKRYLISAVVLLPLLAFLWFSPIGDFRFILSFFGLIGGYGWSQMPVMAAKKETKSGINDAIAKALGLEYSHDGEAGHGFQWARSHKMLPSFQRSNFEDFWSGEVAGHRFTLHEAHLEQRRGSGKNRRWVTVFRGPIITIGCARSFYGTTLLERSGRHRTLGFFQEKSQLKIEGQVLDKADMVHPEFEDAFTIFTTDQTEARVLIHPSYVEKLNALEQAFKGQGIKTLFKDGELTVVLQAKDMFESGSLDHSRDREMVEMCVSQFMAMAALCVELNEEGR